MSADDPGLDPQERIKELEAEVHRLGEGLQARMMQLGMASALLSSGARADILDQIVTVAEEVVRATAAGLFLVDEEAQELIFVVVHGGGGPALENQRIPLGQGIVGFSAVMGQPIAIQDAAQDPRWASDIGAETTYRPETMLCVPMIHNDRVVGVLQLLDKQGGETFTPDDIRMVSRFADLAARALEQSQVLFDLGFLMRSLLTEVEADSADLVERLMSLAGRAQSSASYRETLEIALMVGRLAGESTSRRRLCLGVVAAIDEYFSRSTGAFPGFSTGLSPGS